MIYLTGIGAHFYLLALLDLFGLMQVQHPEPPPQPGCRPGSPALRSATRLFTLLPTPTTGLLFTIPFGGRKPAKTGAAGRGPGESPLADDPWESPPPRQPTSGPDARSLEEGGLDGYNHLLDLPDESAGFGFWQSLFQPTSPPGNRPSRLLRLCPGRESTYFGFRSAAHARDRDA